MAAILNSKSCSFVPATYESTRPKHEMLTVKQLNNSIHGLKKELCTEDYCASYQLGRE